MIRIIGGRPGSGKTYFVVHWLLTRFYYWAKKYQEYMPKDSIPVKIYTNIDGLRLNCVIDLKKAISESPERRYLVHGKEVVLRAGSLESFFCIYNRDLVNSVIIVDEAQSESFFHRFYKGVSVFEFFQWHRHMNVEIFLCVQDVKSLAPDLREIEEFYLEAARSSMRVKGFRYQKMINFEKHGSTVLSYDKRVFAMYKTVMPDAEIQKVGNVYLRYVVMCVILVVILLFGVKFYSAKMIHKDRHLGSDLAMASYNHLEVKKQIEAQAASYSPSVHPPVVASPVSSMVGPRHWKNYDFVVTACEDSGYFQDINGNRAFHVFDCPDRSVTFEGKSFVRMYRKHEEISVQSALGQVSMLPAKPVEVSPVTASANNYDDKLKAAAKMIQGSSTSVAPPPDPTASFPKYGTGPVYGSGPIQGVPKK